MPIVKAQVTFHGISGLPEDVYVNTFHFATEDQATATGDVIVDRISDLYNALSDTLGRTILTYLGEQVSRATPADIKLYDVISNNLPPWHEDTMAVAAASSAASLPGEVALCGSYKNDSVTAVPARNRRGRFYVGPLNRDALEEDSLGTGDVRPVNQLREAMRNGMTAMEADNNAVAVWVVYSRTLNQSFPVESGWIDNAFDTIRSRGIRASGRMTWAG